MFAFVFLIVFSNKTHWPFFCFLRSRVCLSGQPFYSTRVNAADIDSRVKQLDQTADQQQDGDAVKSKAGFWEEFDVRVNPAIGILQQDALLLVKELTRNK